MSDDPPAAKPQNGSDGDCASSESSARAERAKDRYQRYYRHCARLYHWTKKIAWRSKADHWLAVGTWALVVVTWILVLDARSALEKSERAWIAPLGAVQTLRAPLKSGQIFHFDVEYTNTGREPALDVNTLSTRSDLFPLPPDWEKGDWSEFKTGDNDMCQGKEPVAGGATVYPTASFTKYQLGFTVSDQQIINQIIKPDAVMVTKGCFIYITNDSPHTSAFCLYLQPVKDVPPAQWIFKICNDGNHAN